MQENQPRPQQQPPQPPNQPLNIPQDLAGLDVPAGITEDQDSKKERKELFGDALRDEQQKHALHVVFLWFIRIVAVCFILIFLARALHFILPLGWCWLTDTQIQGIDKSFFTGVMGALVARYSKQALRVDSN